MFNLSALIKMINANNDQYIQKEEAENFIKKQKSPSIFNDYLKSINEQVNIQDFENKMSEIIEFCEQEPSIEFKDKKIKRSMKNAH